MEKLSKVNGVIFPGGDADYYELAGFILDYIKKENQNGNYYPLWGICLGFEYVNQLESDQPDKVLGDFVLHNVSLPLEFPCRECLKTDSMLYHGISEQELKALETEGMTFNSHSWSTSPDFFEADESLNSFWQPTALSTMPDGRKIVASAESKEFPFVGTQYHPEKVTSIYKPGLGLNHSWASIKIQEHMMENFVKMTRANTNHFNSYKESLPYLMDNYPVIVTEGT